MFDASEFAAHPMYSVAQGGLDLQQVTGTCSSFSNVGLWSCFSELRSEFEGSGESRGLSESKGVVRRVQIYSFWHEALETTAERKAAAIVPPCHKSYIPSWNMMPSHAAATTALPSPFLSPCLLLCTRNTPALRIFLPGQHGICWNNIRKEENC